MKATTKKPVRKTAAKKKQSAPKSFWNKLFKRGKRSPLVAIVIVGAVVALGYFGYVNSFADATFNASYEIKISSQVGCQLAGRKWDKTANKGTGDCTSKCTDSSAKLIAANKTKPIHYYCTGTVATTISEATCINSLHRYYLKDSGCARRADQKNLNNAPQCIPGYENYEAVTQNKTNVTDRCVAPVIAGAKTKATTTHPGTPAPTTTPTKTTTTTTTAPTTTTTTAKPAAPAHNTQASCQLLGRKWDKTKKTCTTTCSNGKAILLVGQVSGGKYCSGSLISITPANAASLQQACTTHHRVWLVDGCARRDDQHDANNAPQCAAGYPYYNANYKNKTEATTATGGNSLWDWCEVSQAQAQANEKAGTPGAVPAPKTSTSTTTTSTTTTTTTTATTTGSYTGASTDPDPTVDGVKVVLYKEANFKVDAKKDKNPTVTVTEATASLKLPKGWGGKVGSYKIVSGKWMICSSANYVPAKNCGTRWASNPDGAKVASLKPVTTTTLVASTDDTDDTVTAVCVKDGQVVAPNADNTCPQDSPMTCPDGYALKNGECDEVVTAVTTIVPVDASFKDVKGGLTAQQQCELLGREWIGKPAKGTDNGGQYGCSLKTCKLNADGAPRQDKFCVSNKYNAAYAVAMTAKQCSDLHRVYIKQVSMCAQVPNRKDKDSTVVKAKQCTGAFTTYYIYSAKKGKTDECFKPSTFQKAKAVAKTTSSKVGSVLKVGAKAYCNSRKNYHWSDGKCVHDRVVPATSTGSQSGGNNQDPAPTGTTASTGMSSSACAALGRPSDGKGGCKRSCLNSSYVLTNYSDPNAWDKCVKPAATDEEKCEAKGGTWIPAPSLNRGCQMKTQLSNATCSGWSGVVVSTSGGAVYATSLVGTTGIGNKISSATIKCGHWKFCGTYSGKVYCTGSYGPGTAPLSSWSTWIAGGAMLHTYNLTNMYAQYLG